MKRFVERCIYLERTTTVNGISIPKGSIVSFKEIIGAVAALHGYDGDFLTLYKELMDAWKKLSTNDDPLNLKNDADVGIRLYILSEIYKKALSQTDTQQLNIGTFQKVHTEYKNGKFKINPLLSDPENRKKAKANAEKAQRNNGTKVQEADEQPEQKETQSTNQKSFKIYDLLLTDAIKFGHGPLVEMYFLPQANDEQKEEGFKESILQYIFSFTRAAASREQQFNALAISYKAKESARKSIHSFLLKDYYMQKSLSKVISHITGLSFLGMQEGDGGYDFNDKDKTTELAATPIKLIPEFIDEYMKDISTKNSSFLAALVRLLNNTTNTETITFDLHGNSRSLILREGEGYELSTFFTVAICTKFGNEKIDNRNEILKLYSKFDSSKELYGLDPRLVQFSFEYNGKMLEAGQVLIRSKSSEFSKEAINEVLPINKRVIEEFRTGKASEEPTDDTEQVEQNPEKAKEPQVSSEEAQEEKSVQQESFLDRRLNKIEQEVDKHKAKLLAFQKYYDLAN